MHDSPSKPSTRAELDAAGAYAREWQVRADVLDAERLRDLRALSETEAARRFIELLQFGLPAEPRPSSGLVEQQRILARLRQAAP